MLYYWAWGILSAFKKTCGGFCPPITKWTWGGGLCPWGVLSVYPHTRVPLSETVAEKDLGVIVDNKLT